MFGRLEKFSQKQKDGNISAELSKTQFVLLKLAVRQILWIKSNSKINYVAEFSNMYANTRGTSVYINAF